jgi:hypothetical protein
MLDLSSESWTSQGRVTQAAGKKISIGAPDRDRRLVKAVSTYYDRVRMH